MHRILIAALAVLIASPSIAADYRPGPYAGATAGVTTGYLTNNSGDLTTNGVPISGIVGYTHAIVGNLVMGVELEAAWNNVKGSQTNEGFTLTASSDWSAAIKGRLGHAFGPALLYATAGPIWSKSQIKASDGIASISDSDITLNVLAGLGADIQITPTIAMRLEAVRQFSPDAQTWTLGTASTKLDASETTIRLGVIINLQ